MTRKFLLMLVLAPLSLSVARGADYPARPIRLVVPFAAGAGLDSIARLLAPKLSERLGQRIVIDNRPSASGIVGTEIAAQSPPDGYTIAIGNVGTHAANIALFKKLPYDPEKDFIALAQIARVPELMVVHPSVPARSVAEFIALAKVKPGQLTFGSTGQGTTPHLSAILLQSLAGISMVHVPYKGIGPVLVDLMAGQINVAFGNILSTMPHVTSGKLRALGVSSAARVPSAPSVPAIMETVPGYEDYNWYGIFAPVGTPQHIVRVLNAGIVHVLQQPEIRDRLVAGGAEVMAGTPQEFDAFVRKERKKYAKIIKESGIVPE
jgi:tripartite-type tricarboxylate transporter receptor subunit TctC